MGITNLSFSPCGTYLIFSSSTSSTQLTILKFISSSPALVTTCCRPRLAAVLQTNKPIKSNHWRPRTDQEGSVQTLAVVSGEKSLLIWRSSEHGSGESNSSGDEGEEEQEDDLESSARNVKSGIAEAVGIPSSEFDTMLLTTGRLTDFGTLQKHPLKLRTLLGRATETVWSYRTSTNFA